MKVRIQQRVIATEAIVSIEKRSEYANDFIIKLLGPIEIEIMFNSWQLIPYPDKEDCEFTWPMDEREDIPSSFAKWNKLPDEKKIKFRQMAKDYDAKRNAASTKDMDDANRTYNALMTLWDTEKMGEIKDITV